MNTAHQYQIRQEAAQTEASTIPFDVNQVSLSKARISQILPAQAKEVILKYEWLRSMPMAPRFYWGVWFEVDGVEHLGGVLIYCEEYAANTDAWTKYGFTRENMLLLARGACAWWTPKNTASWFISRVNHWLNKNTTFRVITATVDPEAGEVGTVYQASNWDYIGLMPGNIGHGGKENQRFGVIINGKLLGSRGIRNRLGTMKKSEILKEYPDAVFVQKYRKRRYFTFFGKEGKYLRKNIEHLFKPYPQRSVGDAESMFIPRKGFIYRITNTINGKVYIGQTLRPLEERFREYSPERTNNYLSASFNKYGKENFTFEQIDEATTLTELNSLERKWIAHYDSTNRNKGYNLATGGNNAVVSEETRAKMSKAGKGRKQSLEHIARKNAKAGTEDAKKYGRPKTEEEKQHLSEQLKEKAYWKGKKRDPETVAKQKAALTGGKLSAEAYANFIAVSGIAVKVTDPDGTVHEFPTLEAAGKHMGVSKQTARSYANGKFKSKVGYQVELKK
jgi:group I intron endonuclease